MSNPKPIELSREDRQTLETLTRKRNVAVKVQNNARILILKADGWSSGQIANKLDVTVYTVNLCLENYRQGGIARALQNEARSGHRQRVTESDEEWVIKVASMKPGTLGIDREAWSYGSLANYIRDNAAQEGHPALATISTTKIYRIIADSNLLPQRGRPKSFIKAGGEDGSPDAVYGQLSMQFDDDGNVTFPEEPVDGQ